MLVNLGEVYWTRQYFNVDRTKLIEEITDTMNIMEKNGLSGVALTDIVQPVTIPVLQTTPDLPSNFYSVQLSRCLVELFKYYF